MSEELKQKIENPTSNGNELADSELGAVAGGSRVERRKERIRALSEKTKNDVF